MSTNINITVGGNGLLQQSAQFTQANRQAQLQKTSRAAAEQQGVTVLQQERIDQGRDPVTGAPLAAPNSSSIAMARFGPSRIPRIDQQPAANIKTGAPINPLVLDFATAGDPITYPAGAGGGVFRVIRLTGRAKYKGNLLDSRYAVFTSESPPASTSLLLTSTNGGPFNQAYVLCTSSSGDSSSRIDIRYPSTYLAGNIYSDLITSSPPFATLNFLPKLNSPQTIEADVLFPPSSFLDTYCILTLQLTLVDNSILTDESAIASALNWRPFFAGPTTNGFSMQVFRRASVPPYVENEYNRVNILVNSCVNGENLLGAGGLVSEPNSAYEPGWRRIALSVTNTGIRYFENSKLIYSFNGNLTRLFNRLPNTLAGFTWVPAFGLNAEVQGFSPQEPTGVSTIRYSNKRIGNTYIPSMLT